MRFFARRRSRRHTAFVLLVAWLFTLASSVANACFVEAREAHAAAATTAQPVSLQAPAALHAQRGTHADHHPDPGSAKKACLKACDDRKHAVPKLHSGLEHGAPGPATQLATLWAASPHVVSAPRRVDDLTIPIIGPPLRVRYARLAL